MGHIAYQVLTCIKESLVPISAKEIKEQLDNRNINISIKRVYATINDINTFYGFMTGEKYIHVKRRTGYYIKYPYLEDGELQFLIDAVTFNPNLSKREVLNVIDRLLLLSDPAQRERLMITEPKQSNEAFSLLLNLSTLLKAIKKQNNVYFIYVNYRIEDHQLIEIYSENGNVEIDNVCYYAISPYQIVLRGSHYYVLGYFNKRENQMSMYRLDRMRMVRNHNSPYLDIREQFDVEKELEKNVNMFLSSKKITLQFRFKDAILREVVNQFGTSFEAKKDYDNWNMATIKEVAMSDGLIGWILMLHDQIEIVQPITVREEIQSKIQAMKKLYE